MIDLHTHTKYSDGTWTVTELLENAENNGVTILSITDHDCVDAYIELQNIDVSKHFTGKIITGAEFRGVFNGVTIELLGYNFNVEVVKKWLDEHCSEKVVKQGLLQEFNDLVAICKKQNIKIDESIQYNPDLEWPIDKIYYEVTKYLENKNLFSNEEWESSNCFFRSCTSNMKFPLYRDFSKQMPSAKEISNLIRNAEGLVFIAHLFLYELNDYIRYLDDLNNEGIIDGIETYYTDYTDEQTNILIRYCKEKNLLISAGTDCHGEKRKERLIGIGYGNMNVPESIIKNWI